MSDKENKKQSTKPNETIEAPIKNVSVYLSLENCEQFIEKENHADRIAKMRTEGLAYIKETEFLYQK